MRTSIRYSRYGAALALAAAASIAMAESTYGTPPNSWAPAVPSVTYPNSSTDNPLSGPSVIESEHPQPSEQLSGFAARSKWAQERSACVFLHLPTQWRSCIAAVDARFGYSPPTAQGYYSPPTNNEALASSANSQSK